MRDTNRIEPFLYELGKEWERVPDWRFGQLMSNFLCTATTDPFFWEEGKFLDELKEYLDEQLTTKYNPD